MFVKYGVEKAANRLDQIGGANNRATDVVEVGLKDACRWRMERICVKTKRRQDDLKTFEDASSNDHVTEQ